MSHAAEQAHLTVYKDPDCGGGNLWTDAMRKAGFRIEIRDTANIDMVKTQAGVPDSLQACHTAVLESDGRSYIIEGHVPLEAANKLMTERPDIRGIAVPGMPSGSLGMGDDPDARYSVVVIGDGAESKPQEFYEAGQ